MYAIVRCGGRQEKVAVDDVLAVDKVTGEVGSTVTLTTVLVVDDGKVVSDPRELAKYAVTAEVLGESKGPKLSIMKYKSKSGYKRRLGHRQRYTQVKVTQIGDVKSDPTKKAEKPAEKATDKPASRKSAGATSAAGKSAAKAPAKPKASRAKAAKPASKSAEKPAAGKAKED